jgi:hypothetical protein
VTPNGASLTLRHIGLVQKLGFPPQTLRTHQQKGALALSRGEQRGAIANEPDAGFFTQVYLGGPEPFIELEQLSPAFSAGTPASFSMALEGSAH